MLVAGLLVGRAGARSGDGLVESERFAVELHRKVVGIALRVPGGFAFFSSDDRFERMDGEIFPRARAILHRLKEFEAAPADKPNRTVNGEKRKIE